MSHIEYPHKLDYASRPRWHGRRWARIVFKAMVVFAVCAICWKWGPIAYNRAESLYWQRQCLNYIASPKQVVFDFSPSHASQFQGAKDYKPLTMTDIGTAAALSPPACINKYTATFPTPGSSLLPLYGYAFLFMHEMSGANGMKYLVIAYFSITTAGDGGSPDPQVDGRVGLSTDYCVLQPGDLKGFTADPVFGCPKQTRCAGLETSVDFPFGNLRVFAGQIDPADSTHFIIPLQCNSKPGIIDAWLHDDGLPWSINRDGGEDSPYLSFLQRP